MSTVIRNEAEAKYPTKTSTGIDYKAWAKRFVYRAERGDKDLLHVQILFAYQALELPVPKTDFKG